MIANRWRNVLSIREIPGFMIIALLVFCFALPCLAEQPLQKDNVKYPDVWFRDYEGQGVVGDVFYSDFDIWGHEPVVLIMNLDNNTGVAIGYFTQKKRQVYYYSPKRPINKPKLTIFYHGTKRAVKRKHLLSQKLNRSSGVKISNAIERKSDPVLHFGSISKGIIEDDLRAKVHADVISINASDYSRKLIEGNIVYAPIAAIEDVDCEPIKIYLVRSDDNKIIWAKYFIRYYSNRDFAPYVSSHRCSANEKTRLSSTARLALELGDGTALIASYDAVIRIRIADGACEMAPSDAFIVADAADVVRIKLDLMKKEAILKINSIQKGRGYTGFRDFDGEITHSSEIDRISVHIWQELKKIENKRGLK